jgi:FKBP-type peptidyl-prolyl cis-trans isomerase 2
MTAVPNRRPLASVLAAAAAVVLLSGCFGMPPGAADTGDAVTIRYTAYDLETGDLLRENRTVAFAVGSGTSGLGDAVERAVRGHLANDTFTVTVRDDPALDYGELVEVNRTLAPIPVVQSAPRRDFEQFVGPAAVEQTFPAYGIYDGLVTEVTNDTVHFRIVATDGQEDPVPSVGAVLVTHVGETELVRELRAIDGATFSVAPPTQAQPNTPLGLAPGSYKVLGMTDSKLQYGHAQSAPDLAGRDLRVVVTVLEVTPAAADPVPTSGNFGVRSSPQVNGDPTTVLGSPVPSGEAPAADDGHGHTH